MPNPLKVVVGNHYLAFVLDEACKSAITTLFSSKHPVVKCHHVTIAYDFGDEDIPRLQALVDSNPKFSLGNLFTSEVVDVFQVFVNEELLDTDKSVTHLTFAHAESAQSSDSNRLFKDGIRLTGYFFANDELSGHFELIEKKVR